MIARVGGTDAAISYLAKYQQRNNTKVMGHWHPYDKIDKNQPQTSILYLAGNLGGEGSDRDDFDPKTRVQRETGPSKDTGISGGGGFSSPARYVAVAPRDASISLRDLPFGS